MNIARKQQPDSMPEDKVEKPAATKDAGHVSADESFKKLLEESLKQRPMARRGQIVRGTVAGVDQDAVIIDIGAKVEGRVSIKEFEHIAEPLPAVGDAVEVLVQSLGGKEGVNLSVVGARRRSLWQKIEASLAEDTTLPAVVKSEVRGGLRVDLGGMEAFLPRSEIDVSPVGSVDALMGKEVEVVVIAATHKPENVVVSRKRPLEKLRGEKRKAFFSTAAIGDKVSGKVRRLTDFGAFVDLGGVDALLHVSDISWRRLKHPGEALQIGQTIKAEIIKLDPESGRVSLSMRALQPDPWQKVQEKYQEGMRLTGTVRRLLDYGAMVELEPGVEGLLHRSELSWTRRDVRPNQVLKEGDVVDVAVLEVDTERRRISLSLKEVMEDPWKAWMEKHPSGSRVKGTVRSITDFGMFVRLDSELDGLVHIGNLSWHEAGSEAIKAYHKGDEVECVVLGVDVEKQRISLGIKQLQDDPFELFMSNCRTGSKVQGKVTETGTGAATIEIMPAVMARLPLREWPRDREEPKVGDAIKAKVIEVDRKRRRLVISVRRLLRDEEKEAVRTYSKQRAGGKAPSALALELQRKLLAKNKEN